MPSITYAPASSGTYYLSAQGNSYSTGAYVLTAARAGASGVAQNSDLPVDATEPQLATLTGLRTAAANEFGGADFA